MKVTILSRNKQKIDNITRMYQTRLIYQMYTQITVIQIDVKLSIIIVKTIFFFYPWINLKNAKLALLHPR